MQFFLFSKYRNGKETDPWIRNRKTFTDEKKALAEYDWSCRMNPHRKYALVRKTPVILDDSIPY